MSTERVSAAARTFNVAIWGPSQSGKTMFAASLSFARCEGWHIHVEGREFEAAAAEYLDQNRVPKATQQGLPLNLVCTFTRREPNGEFTTIQVKIEDRAGEDWERVTREEKTEVVEGMLKVLEQADAAIILYDLAPHNDGTNVTMVKSICRVISKVWGNRPEKPIAVCLSKCDRKLATAEWVAKAKTEPETVVKYILGRGFEDLSETYRVFFDNVKFFPISSLGLRRVYGAVAPVTFFDELGEVRIVSGTPDERASWQINLTEPFVWIFDKLRQ